MSPTPVSKSRVALLGTIGDLHAEAVRYDLASLQHAVETLEPDFLGVELEPDDWERSDFLSAPIEVREALLPAARRTNTVIVPLGRPPARVTIAPGHGNFAALRSGVISLVDAVFAKMQRTVKGPEAMDAPFFLNACELICHVEEAAAGKAWRRQWEAANRDILERLLVAVRRDPGRSFLVAVQCRRLPWLNKRLRTMSGEIELVAYRHLHSVGPIPDSATAG
jgi:hypothetical protein